MSIYTLPYYYSVSNGSITRLSNTYIPLTIPPTYGMQVTSGVDSDNNINLVETSVNKLINNKVEVNAKIQLNIISNAWIAAQSATAISINNSSAVFNSGCYNDGQSVKFTDQLIIPLTPNYDHTENYDIYYKLVGSYNTTANKLLNSSGYPMGGGHGFSYSFYNFNLIVDVDPGITQGQVQIGLLPGSSIELKN